MFQFFKGASQSVNVTFFHGIVLRREALAERAVHMADVLKAFEVSHPLAENRDLISFGPSFGAEACDAFIARLQRLGLVYVDDFFDLALDHPSWLQFAATLKPEPRSTSWLA